MLEKKVAVVTGASRGIGRAIAKRLAADDIFVIINYRGNREQAEKVKKEIEKNMHKAAAELNFEEAAALRDKMIEINQYLYENK